MKITFTKIVNHTEKVDTKQLAIVMSRARDVDSTSFHVMYKGHVVGDGHLNNRSNMAHVSLNHDTAQDLEGYLVKAIEERSIEIR